MKKRHRYTTSVVLIFVMVFMASTTLLKGQTKSKLLSKAEIEGLGLEASASEFLAQKVTLNFHQVAIKKLLKYLEQEKKVQFSYTKELLASDPKVTVRLEDIMLDVALKEIFKYLPIEYFVFTGGYIVLRENKFKLVEETVSGQVTDASDGGALPGVNIVLKGTAIGTSTDSDGNYQLNVPSLSDTLMFSFVGYQIQEVPINGQTTIDVAMQPQTIAGEELVVTGYSSQREADITGAVSSVNMEDLNQQTTSASVLQKLQGQVSGVNVETNGSPGSLSTVRIRGISSFGNNDPLYVIDGTPVQGGFLNYINPNDIKSMQVLKDAAAASIYGSRANNGVVIIETKKGQSGDIQVSVNASWGVTTPVKGNDDLLIQDALTYHEVVKRAHENAGLPVPENMYGDPNNPTIPNYIWPNNGVDQTNDLEAQFGITEDDYSFPNQLIMGASEGTNWWDAVFDPAFVQDYNLNVSGGSDNATYNVSLNYFDQGGTMKYSFYNRGTVRVNSQLDAGRFIFGENLSFSIDQTSGGMPQGTMGENSVVGATIKKQPITPIRDIRGWWADGKAPGLSNGLNPVGAVTQGRNDVIDGNRFFGNVYTTATILENLEFKSNFGFNVGRSRAENFEFPHPERQAATFQNSFSENIDIFTEWNFSNTLTFRGDIGQNHSLTALAGIESVRDSFRGFNGSQAGFLSTDTDVRYINDSVADPNTRNITTNGGSSTLLSFFGKVDYNYDNKYLVSATIRRDGSSKLGDRNRWGTFPAFSVGWRISEEPFMENQTLLSDLKVRFGFGITGNQQIPTGRTINQFGGGTGSTFYNFSGDGSSLTQGFRLTQLGNNELQWEENVSYNIGLDAEFLAGRLDFVLDLYQRDTDNLLFNPRIPLTEGRASPPFRNVGEMRNKGIDVAIRYNGTISNDLTWNIDLNGSHYKNEIIHIASGQNRFFGPIEGRQGILNVNQLGEPIGAFFGLVTDGIFANQAEVDAHVQQEEAEPGRFRYKDINGDGVINANDRTIIGSPHPDFTGGLNLGIQWKNFDFSTFFFASLGNEIFDLTKEFSVFRLFNTNVRQDRLTDSWTPDDKDAKYPQLNQEDNTSNQYNDFYVEDASYLRLKNLEIGYSLPVEKLPDFGFRNLRIFLQAQNLFTITGYDNIDPALPTNQAFRDGVNVSDQGRGIDRGTFPSNRILKIGLNANF